MYSARVQLHLLLNCAFLCYVFEIVEYNNELDTFFIQTSHTNITIKFKLAYHFYVLCIIARSHRKTSAHTNAALAVTAIYGVMLCTQQWTRLGGQIYSCVILLHQLCTWLVYTAGINNLNMVTTYFIQPAQFAIITDIYNTALVSLI